MLGSDFEESYVRLSQLRVLQIDLNNKIFLNLSILFYKFDSKATIFQQWGLFGLLFIVCIKWGRIAIIVKHICIDISGRTSVMRLNLVSNRMLLHWISFGESSNCLTLNLRQFYGGIKFVNLQLDSFFVWVYFFNVGTC